jgi:hypothetical protein
LFHQTSKLNSSILLGQKLADVEVEDRGGVVFGVRRDAPRGRQTGPCGHEQTVKNRNDPISVMLVFRTETSRGERF